MTVGALKFLSHKIYLFDMHPQRLTPRLVFFLEGQWTRNRYLSLSSVPRYLSSTPRAITTRSGQRLVRHSQCPPSIPVPANNALWQPRLDRTKHKILNAILLLGALPLLLWLELLPPRSLYAEAPGEENLLDDHGQLREIRLAEVQQHGQGAERPWVIWAQSVYDITDWVADHPGGEIILRAAGGSVEPYWKIFTIHQKQEVYDILEQYLIGTIDKRDLVNGQVPTDSIDDPFLEDSKRHPNLRILTKKPCNAETPGEGLSDFMTANEFFFVRNHMWVPTVDEQTYRLTVESDDGEEKTYSMRDLKENFPRTSITATMQCSGNRRKHMTDNTQPTNGIQWTVGAIGNATWTGVRLRDLLLDAGFPVDNPPENAKHAQFSGLEAYGASIAMSKALDSHGDVLLAYEMNGSELPRDHGFPLRVIVPGNVAARSVKWVHRISISAEESRSQWQRRDYKSFGPNEGANPNWDHARAIQEMPVTSAITMISSPFPSPHLQDGIKRDSIIIEGYAYSGGGREIVRVDISKDNGRTWDQAELIQDEQKGSKAWCWKRWRYEVPAEEISNTTLVVKAIDEAYNTQPENYDSIYNVRGNLTTAWHRVPLRET